MKRMGALRSAMAMAALLMSASAMAQDRPWPHAPVHGGSDVAGTSLSIDELYQPKSLIGTSPEGYSWSRDGGTVLFLWNDEGYSYRDIWSYSVKTGKKTRLTFLGRDSKPEAEQKGIAQAVALDGGRVAFTLGGALHIRSADGTIAKVESDKQAVRRLAVSPDGRSLAFIAGNPGDTRNRVTMGGVLWTRDLAATDDKAARRVIGSDDPKIYIDDYQWSADGKAIVFQQSDDRAMAERDIFYHAKGELQNNRVVRAFPGEETTRATVGLVDLASGTTRMFERPDAKHHIWSFGLSGDGRRVFVSGSDMEAKEHSIYVFDAATGARETFYQLREPKHLRTDWQVAWAPGDDGLIILTDRDGWLHLYHQRAAGEKPRQITSGSWEIAEFDIDHARRQIYFTANKSYLSDRQIYRVPLAGGAVQQVSGKAAGTHEPVYSPDFRHIADWYSNDTTPPEMFVIDAASPAKVAKVTQSPQPGFYKQTWANIGYAEFPSHVDGVNLVARISLPANYDPARKYPVIVGSVYSDAVRNQWGGTLQSSSR